MSSGYNQTHLRVEYANIDEGNFLNLIISVFMHVIYTGKNNERANEIYGTDFESPF